MNLIAITLHRKAYTADTKIENYLRTVDTLPAPHDYSRVVKQADLDGNNPPWPSAFTRLACGGFFIKGQVLEIIDPDTGLSGLQLTYYVDTTAEATKDITLDNAYEKYYQFRKEHAQLAGLSEFDAWYSDAVRQSYNETYSVAIDNRNHAHDWFLDHMAAYRDPILTAK